MKTVKSLSILLALACSLQACHNSDKTNDSNTTTLSADSILDTVSKTAQSLGGKLDKEETAFIQSAAIGGMMEVAAGNMALQKSKDQQIKSFAEMMVKDHTKANTELEALAKSKGLGLPASFPEEAQKHMDVMKTLAGEAFDRSYIAMMETDHNKTIDLFTAASRYNDVDIKNFSTKTLPVLRAHYKIANKLDSLVMKKKTNNGDDLLDISTGDKKKNE
jgi:putative membrane protein